MADETIAKKVTIAIITIKVMMDSPDTDIPSLEDKLKKVIKDNGGEFYKTQIEEIAFGLKALKVSFTCDEKLGSDLFEEKFLEVEGVGNAQCIDFRRTIG